MRCLAGRLLRIFAGVFLFALPAVGAHAADAEDTIASVKVSIVAVGTFEPARSPAFRFLGTGFAVGDGTLIVTNAHVLPTTIDSGRRERIAILIPAAPGAGSGDTQTQVRDARTLARDPGHDLAVLKIEGASLPALRIGDSSSVREGRSVYFTGFPIGSILGAHAATHRAIIAAITPIAIPQRRASELDATTAKRLSTGPFPVFQLDGIAFPGNSGSPVYGTDGAVVGVINMVLVRATKESLLSQPSGLAYAVPSEHLRALLATLR